MEQSSIELDTHEQTHNCEVIRLQEEKLNLQAGNNGLKLVCDFLKIENNDLKEQNEEFKNKNEELQNKCSTLELEHKIMKKDILKLNKKLHYVYGMPEIELIRTIITDEALIYVAGYVAYRFRSKYSMLGTPTREIPNTDPTHWICHISRGSLIYPLDELLSTYVYEMPENELIRTIITDEALIYVAGYVAYRFRSKYPMLGTPTREIPNTDPTHWICHISRGSLIYPLDELLSSARILEKDFKSFHKDSLSDTNLIFVKVASLVKRKIDDQFHIPDEAFLCLVRTRTYIRLRELNKIRKDSYGKIRIAERSAKAIKFYS
ncbi:hypothetical protein TSAR_009035 [Trichomalopsis sarcophagae]|uniref:Uncharacterized protein n=1 Tax=Trichomalopsis sarcophagae TaxID=543379 RepID=A0A232ESE5_9HYME|nr:hypothetical protein TSAR_009035 [Trichomalopsis sarcophagae]